MKALPTASVDILLRDIYHIQIAIPVQIFALVEALRQFYCSRSPKCWLYSFLAEFIQPVSSENCSDFQREAAAASLLLFQSCLESAEDNLLLSRYIAEACFLQGLESVSLWLTALLLVISSVKLFCL